jgi:phage shock protein C
MRSRRKFTLDRANGKLLGVCAGIANMMGWDATFVRIGVVLVTLLGGWRFTLVAYGVAALVGWARRPSAPASGFETSASRGSSYDLRHATTDLDRRLAEVDTFVATSNTSLAREIEQLR